MVKLYKYGDRYISNLTIYFCMNIEKCLHMFVFVLGAILYGQTAIAALPAQPNFSTVDSRLEMSSTVKLLAS